MKLWLTDATELLLLLSWTLLLFIYHSTCIYGGGNRRQQIDIVNKGVEIVIGKLTIFHLRIFHTCEAICSSNTYSAQSVFQWPLFLIMLAYNIVGHCKYIIILWCILITTCICLLIQQHLDGWTIFWWMKYWVFAVWHIWYVQFPLMWSKEQFYDYVIKNLKKTTPMRGIEPRPRRWKRRILTTRPHGTAWMIVANLSWSSLSCSYLHFYARRSWTKLIVC